MEKQDTEAELEKLDVSVVLLYWENLDIVFDVYYAQYPPLGLAQIAAILKKEIKDVSIIDSPAMGYKSKDVLKIIEEKQPDFLIYTVRVLVVILAVILLFRGGVRKIFIKGLHELEKEGRIIEKEIEKEFRKI